MGSTVREVTVHRTANLDLYRGLDHLEPLIEEISQRGREVSNLLGASRVWMLNSTASGGGVAEMLPHECNLLNAVGVDTRWLVLETSEQDFFRLTKDLHNRLHGEPGAPIEERRALYERISLEASEHLRQRVTSHDILIVHDPQPVAAAALLRPEHRPHLVWRCHIGVPFSNEHTETGWGFLRPWLKDYSRMLFSAEAYIPDEHFDRSGVIYPGIDPLSHKNRELRPYKLIGILRSAGLVDGPPSAPWAQFEEPVRRYAAGAWAPHPIPHLLHRPLIVQISRFDRLKGFQQLIPAFERLLSLYPEKATHMRADTERIECELQRVELVLAGPDPDGVVDDPEGREMLAELVRQYDALPEALRPRVHLLRLPMANRKQNALIVNALQRLASVVVQNSQREGFGLTAAEALIKGTPVVASNVGGLCVQIRHGIDGLLVDDPCDPDELARALLEMLAYPKRSDEMARSGRTRVREHFLVLSLARSWLRELGTLLTARTELPPPLTVATPPG